MLHSCVVSDEQWNKFSSCQMLLTIQGNVYTAWIYATCFTAENFFTCPRTAFLYFVRPQQYTTNNSLQNINWLGSVIFPMVRQPLVGLDLPIVEVPKSHSDISQSVALLWISDRIVAETPTWQHTTLARDRYPCPRWESNPQSQQAIGRRLTP